MFSIIAMAGQQGGQGNPLGQMLPFFIIFFAIFYFLIIRPQQKKQKKFQEMINNLKEYDQIVTSGGIYATVVSIKETTVIVKIADNIKFELNKGNIALVISEKPEQPAAKK